MKSIERLIKTNKWKHCNLLLMQVYIDLQEDKLINIAVAQEFFQK